MAIVYQLRPRSRAARDAMTRNPRPIAADGAQECHVTRAEGPP